MARQVSSRSVGNRVERELWARSAGRCEFDGCNRPLFKSPVTQESVNISEKAHIYSFSKGGPRGWGPFVLRKGQINDLANLILVCQDCHKTIDQDKDGLKYSAELLMKWKEEHEHRIAVVTGVAPSKRSHVILYGANIGDQTSLLNPDAAKDALFPNWYPAEERVISLSMQWEGKDHDDSFWQTETENLITIFNRQVKPVLDGVQPNHLSLFGLAPMPLLTMLGALLTDKVPAEVYQLHREPRTWKWLDGPSDFAFQVKRPLYTKHAPALVISLSDSIAPERIATILGMEVSIWELTVEQPHNDFLKSRDQLSKYRETVRRLMVEIGKSHGKSAPLAIFPAMPVACAIELGRVRMPKADSPWTIYDYNNRHDRFLKAITIGREHG